MIVVHAILLLCYPTVLNGTLSHRIQNQPNQLIYILHMNKSRCIADSGCSDAPGGYAYVHSAAGRDTDADKRARTGCACCAWQW